MQKFYDYDVDHPFDVFDEIQIIEDGKIRLKYTPLQGSVNIAGFKEVLTSPNAGEFYINYQAGNQYRMADQIVNFDSADNGKEIKVSYKGVSTLILAQHLNELSTLLQNTLTGSFDLDKTNVTVTAVEENKLTVDSPVKVGYVYTMTDDINSEKVKVLAFEDGVATVDKLDNTYENGRLLRTTGIVKNGAVMTNGSNSIVEWKPEVVWRGSASEITSEKFFLEDAPDYGSISNDCVVLPERVILGVRTAISATASSSDFVKNVLENYKGGKIE